MKNLATCTPEEFLQQSWKIKKNLEKWMNDINLKGIRARKPDIEVIPPDASSEEKARIIRENGKRVKEQSMANLSAILDAAMGEHPKETMEVLALFCFVEPEDVNKHTMSEYIQCLVQMINDKAVVDFFTLCYQLGQTGMLTA